MYIVGITLSQSIKNTRTVYPNVRVKMYNVNDVCLQVAKRKRSHSTYHQELEHACTPLLPHAWLGVIEERMEQWRVRHKRWKQPANLKRSTPNLLQRGTQNSTSPSVRLKSKSCFSPSTPGFKATTDTLHSVSLSPTKSSSHSTSQSLSDAQLLAASPRGTRLEQVACVMLYRSRGDVDIPDIGRRCPHVSTLSLTKCGAMRMGVKEGEEVGGAWEDLVELNLQVHINMFHSFFYPPFSVLSFS